MIWFGVRIHTMHELCAGRMILDFHFKTTLMQRSYQSSSIVSCFTNTVHKTRSSSGIIIWSWFIAKTKPSKKYHRLYNLLLGETNMYLKSPSCLHTPAFLTEMKWQEGEKWPKNIVPKKVHIHLSMLFCNDSVTWYTYYIIENRNSQN